MGGLFRRCETKLKQFTLEIGIGLCLKLDKDQTKKRSLLRLGARFRDLI